LLPLERARFGGLFRLCQAVEKRWRGSQRKAKTGEKAQFTNGK